MPAGSRGRISSPVPTIIRPLKAWHLSRFQRSAADRCRLSLSSSLWSRGTVESRGGRFPGNWGFFPPVAVCSRGSAWPWPRRGRSGRIHQRPRLHARWCWGSFGAGRFESGRAHPLGIRPPEPPRPLESPGLARLSPCRFWRVFPFRLFQWIFLFLIDRAAVLCEKPPAWI